MERKLPDRELLDNPQHGCRAEIERNLVEIASANRWLGGTSVVLRHLLPMLSSCDRRPIRIIDMATGLADIPMAIADWARRNSVEVRITAVDRHPVVLEIARERTRDYHEIALDEQDIRSLHYPSRAFDFAICSQAIHHLEDSEAAMVLAASNRLATQGIVISDLRRGILPGAIVWSISRISRNRLSRHDAGVSITNAFTPDGLRAIADAAGLPCYKVYRHGPCRLALVVDKRTMIYTEELCPVCHSAVAA